MIIYSLICLQTVLNSLDLFRVDVGMELILLKDIRTRRTFDFSSTVLVLSMSKQVLYSIHSLMRLVHVQKGVFSKNTLSDLLQHLKDWSKDCLPCFQEKVRIPGENSSSSAA